MTHEDAAYEAAKLLKDEANELALLANQPVWKDIPHRARVAIRSEIERLRKIAQTINPE